MNRLAFSILALAALAGCTREVRFDGEYLNGNVAVVHDFESEDGTSVPVSTKSTLSDKGVFAWTEGDVIGVVPCDDRTMQTNFVLYSISEDAHKASFDGGEWALKEGSSYAAYYPFQPVVLTSASTVNVSFTGQKQAADNSLAHLGAYDYLYASPVVAASDKVLFNFKHKATLFRVKLNVADAAVYTGLTVNASKEIFALDADFNVADGTFTAGTMSSAMDLELDNISVSKGSEFTAWLMVLPNAQSRYAAITVTLTDNAGNKYTYDSETLCPEFKAGKAYSMSFDKLDPDIIFKDNFNWLRPLIDAYDELNPGNPIGNSVTGYTTAQFKDASNANSPNAYTAESLSAMFPQALAEAGYTDLNSSSRVIYPQATHLKLGKTSVHTSLMFSPFTKQTSTGDYEMSFDWCRHVQNSGKIDPVTLTLVITGMGHFENGTKYSDPLTTVQDYVENEYAEMGWHNSTVAIYGAGPSTQLNLVYTDALDTDTGLYNWTASGAHRYHIDNIIIRRNSAPSPGPDPDLKPTAGSTVYGQVLCDGRGVPNVVVSDGYEVVKTNSMGVYQLPSKKKCGYVFISIPSGYEVETSGVLPLFHKYLTASASVAERVDFTLYDAGDQTNHTMLFFGDMHLANRTKDISQFSDFIYDVNRYRVGHKNEKIYAMTLGDMTWDLYWYSRNFVFEQYLSNIRQMQYIPVFHTIGNHDHDMNATGDWDTVLRYRKDVCPNYYSFNIGKVHYIAIDDIECTNKTASTTDGQYRTYNEKIVSDIIAWLKKDLSYVDKATPIVMTSHAPVFKESLGNNISNASDLTSVFSGYNVTIVTGHTHVMYNAKKSSSLNEYNSAAVCGAWWWAGKYNSTYNICTDGTPNGYRIIKFKGATQDDNYYKAVGRDADYQFRAYDRNCIKITADAYGITGEAATSLLKETALSVIHGNYGGGSSSNDVIINVWDWNDKWKISVKEDGKALTVTPKTLMDPSFYIAYTVPRLKENTSVSWHPSPTGHMFTVSAASHSSTLEITVTDDEGRVYTQTMKRPMAFTIENYK